MENTLADEKTAEIQRRYGGQYIARVDDQVIASAASYRELSRQIDQKGLNWGKLIIEYVEPATSVSVFHGD